MQVIDKTTTSQRRSGETRALLIDFGYEVRDWGFAVPVLATLAVLYGVEFGVWAGVTVYLVITIGGSVLSLVGGLWALRRDAVEAERAGLELPTADRIGGGSR